MLVQGASSARGQCTQFSRPHDEQFVVERQCVDSCDKVGSGIRYRVRHGVNDNEKGRESEREREEERERAAPLVRGKAKITVKFAVCESLRRQRSVF